jgi:hypothetical protein
MELKFVTIMAISESLWTITAAQQDLTALPLGSFCLEQGSQSLHSVSTVYPSEMYIQTFQEKCFHMPASTTSATKFPKREGETTQELSVLV